MDWENRVREANATVGEAKALLAKCVANYNEALETYIRAVVQRDLLYVESGDKRLAGREN